MDMDSFAKNTYKWPMGEKTLSITSHQEMHLLGRLFSRR